jgi:hypothetical protein
MNGTLQRWLIHVVSAGNTRQLPRLIEGLQPTERQRRRGNALGEPRQRPLREVERSGAPSHDKMDWSHWHDPRCVPVVAGARLSFVGKGAKPLCRFLCFEYPCGVWGVGTTLNTHLCFEVSIGAHYSVTPKCSLGGVLERDRGGEAMLRGRALCSRSCETGRAAPRHCAMQGWTLLVFLVAHHLVRLTLRSA